MDGRIEIETYMTDRQIESSNNNKDQRVNIQTIKLLSSGWKHKTESATNKLENNDTGMVSWGNELSMCGREEVRFENWFGNEFLTFFQSGMIWSR